MQINKTGVDNIKIEKLRYEYPLFWLVLITFLMFLLSACSGKTDNGKGTGPATGQEEASSIRDKEQERARLQSLAQQGEAGAQYKLGNLFLDGGGDSQDQARAAEWHRKAAEQGHVEAQVSLGYMYFPGRGVILDNAEAVTWFRRAAEQGHPRAQYMLGLCAM